MAFVRMGKFWLRSRLFQVFCYFAIVMPTSVDRDRLTTTVLSGIAGYVDTASFVSLNGLFTAHVTGNLVVAGVELAGASGGAVWVRLAIIPVFITAVIITTVMARTRPFRLPVFLWLEAVTLLVFAIAGILLVPDKHHFASASTNAFSLFFVGAIGVFSMGIQNTLMREVFGNLAPTTVMTGNLTQFTIDLARLTVIHDYQHTANPQHHKQEIKQRICKFGDALIGFMVGATFGALLTRQVGLGSILVPMGVTALLAICTAQSREIRLMP